MFVKEELKYFKKAENTRAGMIQGLLILFNFNSVQNTWFILVDLFHLSLIPII